MHKITSEFKIKSEIKTPKTASGFIDSGVVTTMVLSMPLIQSATQEPAQ